MKKLYTFITAIVGSLAYCASAQTTTEDIDLMFCVNIDDPTLCYGQDGYGQRIDLQQGENIFSTTYHKTTYSDGSTYGYSDTYYIYIENDKQADYLITACEVLLPGNSERIPYDRFSGPTPSMNFVMTPEMNGAIFYPTISNLDELRTATATVNIDDASNVRLRIGSNNYMPELKDGENVIRFNPSAETNWTIGPRNYGTYLGGVTHNGNAITENYGNFYLTVSQGDVIDVSSQPKTEPVSVTVTFANEDMRDAVTAVYTFVNYVRQEVNDWRNGFTVDPRTQIILSLDLNAYKINSFVFNGEPQYIYNSDIYLTIVADTKIEIDAVKYSTFDLQLTLTDPSHVTIGVAESQYSSYTQLDGLIAGIQDLQISEKNTYMVINKVDGYVIDRVAYQSGDTETEVDYTYGGYYVPLTGTSHVIVDSHSIVRNQTATLWVNDISQCYNMYMQRADASYCFHTSYEPNPVPTTGENTFAFDVESDNPISLYFSPINYDVPGYVTINGQIISPKYDGSTNYEFSVADGDIIRLFLGQDPATSSVIDINTSTSVGEVYNIMGVKMANPSTLTPGLYIINGNKVIVK